MKILNKFSKAIYITQEKVKYYKIRKKERQEIFVEAKSKDKKAMF